VSVEDDATGEELVVVWEIEPGVDSIERPDLPGVEADRIDEPWPSVSHLGRAGAREFAPAGALARSDRQAPAGDP